MHEQGSTLHDLLCLHCSANGLQRGCAMPKHYGEFFVLEYPALAECDCTFEMPQFRDNIVILNDYVSLPIIISDWDAIKANRRQSSDSVARESERGSGAAASDTSSATASGQKWATGFSDYVDEFWNNLTSGMKQKLREACVEVLRRTDDTNVREMCLGYDDDARFLD